MDIAHERPFPPTKAEFEMLQREIKHLHADVDKVCNLNLSLKSQNARLREALREISEDVDDEVDIDNNGNPNTAMKVRTICKQALKESGDV